MNFEEIILTKKELSRLKKLNKCAKWIPSSDQESKLLDLKLINHQLCYDNGVSIGFYSWISDRGKDYLAYLTHQNRRDRRETARFYFSTGISVLALIIAIIALAIDLWQLGLL